LGQFSLERAFVNLIEGKSHTGKKSTIIQLVVPRIYSTPKYNREQIPPNPNYYNIFQLFHENEFDLKAWFSSLYQHCEDAVLSV